MASFREDEDLEVEMGISVNIGYDIFPEQGGLLGASVQVIFDHTERRIQGKIVRDDREVPGRTIIQLQDGRIILGTECSWRLGWVRPSECDRCKQHTGKQGQQSCVDYRCRDCCYDPEHWAEFGPAY